MARPTLIAGKIAAENRRARRDYEIKDTIEAGIVLVGTEVKSLRAGRANLADSFAAQQAGELYLFNAYIPEYQRATSSPTKRGGHANCWCAGARCASWSARSHARA